MMVMPSLESKCGLSFVFFFHLTLHWKRHGQRGSVTQVHLRPGVFADAALQNGVQDADGFRPKRTVLHRVIEVIHQGLPESLRFDGGTHAEGANLLQKERHGFHEAPVLWEVV